MYSQAGVGGMQGYAPCRAKQGLGVSECMLPVEPNRGWGRRGYAPCKAKQGLGVSECMLPVEPNRG